MVDPAALTRRRPLAALFTALTSAARALFRRLRKKLFSLLPILAGFVVLLGGLSALIAAVEQYLPGELQTILTLLRYGDWEGSRTSLTRFFDGYGSSASYIFLMIQVAQVLFAPIPGQLVGLLGGYLFGFWHGLAVTMLGVAIGSFIAISIGRLLGEYVVRKLIPPNVLSHFDYLIDEGGLWNFFLIFLLPILPDDAVCLIAGLTHLSLWKLVLVCILGRLPGMAVLTFAGSNAGSNMLITQVVLACALVSACILWLFDEEVEAWFSHLGKGRSTNALNSAEGT